MEGGNHFAEMQFLCFFDGDVGIFIVVVAFTFQFIGQKRFDLFIEIFLFYDLQNVDQSGFNLIFLQNLIFSYSVDELCDLVVLGVMFEEHFDD